MSHRLPESTDRPSEWARFTFTLWEGLNGKYQFYVERWRRTLEFIRDQHWQALKQYDRTVLPNWRRFPLQSYTLAFYNDYLTDFLKSEVRFSAIPTSPDPHDIDAAELAEQLMKHLWNKLGMDRKRIDLAAWIIATGTAAVRVYWDTDTGDLVPLGIPQPGGGIIPIDPDTLQAMPGAEPAMVDSGEIDIEVVSPQYVRWAENPSHGVMLGLLLSYEEAKAFYGEDVADRLQYADTHQGVSADLNQIEQPGVTPSIDQRALVIEHYIPPSAEHPEGLWWTAAQGGQMLIHGPWPLPAGVVPIVSFRWVPVPGENHIGLSPLYGITFQNKIYEEITAKILEWYNKAKPKRLLKAGGGISAGDITDEPYQELVVNAGGEPENMDVDDAPSGLFQVLNLIQGDLQITTGRAFEEGSQLPEGLAQGRTRQPAELKQSKAITTAFMNAKTAWKEVGEILMHYVGNFYNEDRVVAIQGPDKQFLWREFRGDQLVREGDLAATLMVDDIPLFPQNRQNLRDTVVALLQSQAGQLLFAGPDGQVDMDRVDAALQATGLDVHFDNLDPDVMEARNEEVAFRNLREGQDPPQVREWQEHGTHYESHTKILKGQRFKAWPQHAQQAFLQHVQQTGEVLNQQAESEAQAMVEQERQLREVREQAEVRADVMKEWARQLIALVAESTGLELQDIYGLLEKDRVQEDEEPTTEGE